MNDKIPSSRTLHMYEVDGTVLCIYDQNDSLVVDVMDGQMSNDDARRMVACWNACDGIPTDRLEGVPMRKTTLGEMFGAFAEVSRRRIEASMYEETCANFETEILSLKSQRDQLLTDLETALKQLEEWEVAIDAEWGSGRSIEELEKDGVLSDATISARAAIAACKGGAV